MEKQGKEKYFSTKRIIVALLILALVSAGLAVIIHYTTKVTNESYEKCVLGDVNGDGYINSGDALEINKMILGQVELFENQKKNADVNCDGVVNSLDAGILMRYCVGEIKSIPYCDEAPQEEKTSDEKLMQAENDNIIVNAKILNQWENSDGQKSYQISITAKNISDTDISDWTVNLTTSNSVELSRKWDCTASVDENTISVSGEKIPKANTASCGLIVVCEDGLTINNIEME